MMNLSTIPAYIINLPARNDRRAHTLATFAGRDEFAINIVKACTDPVGAVGLWKTIRHILQNLVQEEDEFILLCEDDHQFTQYYSKEYLWQCMEAAHHLEAEILLGGISWLTAAFRVTDHIFWVEKFSGLQFTILFKRFFEKILRADFVAGDAADHTMAGLAQNKFFIYPFLSTQKEFGYSDVTLMNNATQRVDELFATSAHNVRTLITVEEFFKAHPPTPTEMAAVFSIPAYIIGHNGDSADTEPIRKQFEDKPEFDIVFIEKPAHPAGNNTWWKIIQEIVWLSINNDDDLIVICDDTHVFTQQYTATFLLKNIIEAHEQYADLLVGGTAHFGFALPVGQNRFWCDECHAGPFIVLYKKFFSAIVNSQCKEDLSPGMRLSQLAENRMMLYPFISKQQPAALADGNGSFPEAVDPFSRSENRLKEMQQARAGLIVPAAILE